MQIKENISLRKYNTFGLEAAARYFAEIDEVEDLQELIETDIYKKMPKYIIGGGSNILLTGDLNALVIKNNLKGIDLEKEDEDHVWVRSMSGEIWHQLVLFCIDKGWGGIENLSLIPGSVGAAPIQNIGAYGVEIKEVFDHLEAVDMENGRLQQFDATGCRFGYRNSVFKNELKGKYFITAVTLKLSKKPEFNMNYGAIKETIEELGPEEVSVKKISEAVCRIRQSKLPDPKVIGNAGSFFKNPEIDREKFEKLQQEYPQIPHYELPDDKVKVPAGWLIEQCGWKGKKIGNTGSHAQQALVLVNYGGATGIEIKELSDKILSSVKDKFGIALEPEVNIL